MFESVEALAALGAAVLPSGRGLEAADAVRVRLEARDNAAETLDIGASSGRPLFSFRSALAGLGIASRLSVCTVSE